MNPSSFSIATGADGVFINAVQATISCSPILFRKIFKMEKLDGLLLKDANNPPLGNGNILPDFPAHMNAEKVVCRVDEL